MTSELVFLNNAKALFKYYKSLADKSFKKINDQQIHFRPHEYSNNISIIAKHICGNMKSRWTDFLESDGEKTWRNRDQEFEDSYTSKKELLEEWEDSWKILFDSLEKLNQGSFGQLAFIRNEGHHVIEAINRQISHYAYHVGQIVFLSKWIQESEWTSLSIAKGASKTFNQKKFEKPKQKKNFV